MFAAITASKSDVYASFLHRRPFAPVWVSSWSDTRVFSTLLRAPCVRVVFAVAVVGRRRRGTRRAPRSVDE